MRAAHAPPLPHDIWTTVAEQSPQSEGQTSNPAAHGVPLAQAAPPVEKVVPVHAMHVESVDALPAVQADPSAHSACVGSVQLTQAAPPVEKVVPVQASPVTKSYRS